MPTTQVKILRGVTIYCQKSGCEQTATHLFRSGRGPILAYCESHAIGEAERLGIDLPVDTISLFYKAGG